MAKPGRDLSHFIQTEHTGDAHRKLEYRGQGAISGITTLGPNLTPGPCRVFLHDLDGTFVAFRRSDENGLYIFDYLREGPYRLIIEDDNRQEYQGKIQYVEAVSAL